MEQALDLRAQLRKEMRQRRRSLSAPFQEQASRSLVDQLTPFIEKERPQSIATYLSNDGELSTQPLINYCWQQNIDVYLPVLHPFSKGHLLFLHYVQMTPMTSNRYGIIEPQLDVNLVSPAKQIDMIFTPLVAFDKSGARLGMGGGFYDRTISQLVNSQAKTQVIGLAHDCQCVEQIPTEVWDMPLDQIFTPTKYYEC